jgi:hypothetical protein
MLGSRTFLALMIASLALTIVSGMSNPARIAGLLKIGALVLLSSVFMLQIPVVQDAVGTFTLRWQQASHVEGDVGQVFDKRVFGVVELGIEKAGNTPWLGKGIGMGSSYAAVASNGEVSFMLGETEWERVVPEMGPICGLLFMGARLAFVLFLIIRARRALGRGQMLAWLLIPAAVSLAMVGIMEQTTYLGYMVFIGGLCMAASREFYYGRAVPQQGMVRA